MVTSPLSADELERYARHIVLREVGGPGQQALKRARVLVIGAGGLGSPLLLYLAAAGVGDARHRRRRRGGAVQPAAPGAARHRRCRPAQDRERRRRHRPPQSPCRGDGACARLTADNARELVRGWDVVADGSDNFATRYAVSDACCLEGKPLVTAALGAFDATLTTLRPFETGPDGEPNPTYRCLFPAAPPPGAVPACAEAGVLGALAGVAGSLMALEVIRAIVGFGTPLVGRLLLIDARAMRFETLAYRWDPDNPLTGRASAAADAGLIARVISHRGIAGRPAAFEPHLNRT